jgi:hypothetical protein
MSQSEDLKRASRETADRLRARGIRLTGHESADDLVTIEDAVERFEEAVISRGGDLMVDEGAPGRWPQPDDPHFALPVRGQHELVAAYLDRIERATDAVRRHRPLA